jgi:TolB protein
MQAGKVIVSSLAALVLVALTAGSTAARTPANNPWTILLTSNREKDSELYRVNADGTGALRLTHVPGFDGFATASPDGRRIVYHSQDRRVGKPRGAYVMNADGTGRRHLTDDGCPCSWSPDGKRIVFSSGRDGNGELYVVNADGSGQRPLVTAPSSNEWSPTWSPDGRTIVFATDRDGNAELYSVDADGSNPRNLTNSPGNDGGLGGMFSALWSPDARKLAFVSTRDTRTEKDPELYVMNADGSDIRRVTHATGYESLLGWSPDGRKLAFQSFPSTPRWAFFVMGSDGNGVRQVNWALPGHST